MKLRLLPVMLSALAFLPAGAAQEHDFFEKRIRPLLVERCYQCHSAGKKVKGGLRLDTRDGWSRGGDSGPAIQPGKPDDSLLLKAVSYTDRDLKMPPKQKLREDDIAALREWITQGAPDPRSETAVATSEASTKPKVVDAKTWWSFQPIPNPRPPEVKDNTWPRNAIDRFILARLEAAGFKPAPDAPPAVLARRLSYDLTGLPPSSTDAETRRHGDTETESVSPSPPLPISQSSSPTPATLESQISSLLNSPQFAERFASHWLDITRFAESSGGGRTLPFKDAWRYRDYVIESFRDNVPLDRFLTQQIAGDLLPHESSAARRANLTATAFLVLGPTNYEEQDKEQLRMDIVDEQLDTLGKSFLGLTLGCARCHDHKFDPIPTRDYYALAGILRSTKIIKDPKENVAHWIDTPLPMDEPLENQLRAKEAKLAGLKLELDQAKTALKKAGVESALKKLKPGPLAISELPGIIVDDSEAKLIGDWKHSSVFKTFIGRGYISDHNREKGGLTATFQPKMIEAGRYEVRLAYVAASDRETKVPVTILHADGETAIKVDETEPPPVDGRWVSLGTFRFEANGEGYVLISNTDTTNYVTADAVQFLKVEDKPAVPLAKKKTAKGSVPKTDRVAALEKEIKSLESTGPKRPEAMTVGEQDGIEDCPIHIRGQTRNLGAKVPRGFLSAFRVPVDEALPDDQSGRVQLARWLVSRDNPLTARVFANRIWLWLMGEGLVRTPDNFGSTGEMPSHPELLDYLASELIGSGWDLRHLVRLIASSRTYQMSSSIADSSKTGTKSNAQSLDPDNRLYRHANRKRLDAEQVRDTILTISGSLDARVGGSVINDATAVDSNDSKAANIEYGYQFTDSRRSLYTPAFRNVRHPLFEVFDFADINGPVGKRNTSTVATQELFLLNHPFVIEQARAAATRLLQQSGVSDEQRIRSLYDAALGRAPSAIEMKHALSYIDASVSGNATPDELRDVWARLLQALIASPDFRFLD